MSPFQAKLFAMLGDLGKRIGALESASERAGSIGENNAASGQPGAKPTAADKLATAALSPSAEAPTASTDEEVRHCRQAHKKRMFVNCGVCVRVCCKCGVGLTRPSATEQADPRRVSSSTAARLACASMRIAQLQHEKICAMMQSYYK